MLRGLFSIRGAGWRARGSSFGADGQGRRARWRRLSPVRTSWSVDDPQDPDFQAEFCLPPNADVHIRIRPPLRWAQRLFHKAPALKLVPQSGRWHLCVTLGMTRLNRVAGTRLDVLLSRLIALSVAELEDFTDLEASGHLDEDRTLAQNLAREAMASPKDGTMRFSAYDPIDFRTPAPGTAFGPPGEKIKPSY